ncbi:MAG: DUF418 domain-containing protein [Verrucomicrobia bacterium]|nr:DUF418 domain-containing protein [Verrucomicrobiota bacterium]
MTIGKKIYWLFIIGYGLGLYGQVAPSSQIPIAMLFFVGQVKLSVLWIKRFQKWSVGMARSPLYLYSARKLKIFSKN